MRDTKQRVFKTVKDFINAVHLKKKAMFRSDQLRAAAVCEHPRTQYEEFKIRYEYNANGQWVAFSDCQSPTLAHILDDFKMECQNFNIAV